MAIAAHEVGHAQQVAEGSALMQLRGLLVPAASVGPSVAYILIIGGLIFHVTGLVTLGILLFGLAVLFSILTLPVEIQASQKASRCSNRPGWSRPRRTATGRSRCFAAALTYLAAAVASVLTLLYYLTLARRST